jgi:hypothetical protein
MTEKETSGIAAKERTNTSLTKDIGQTVPSAYQKCQPLPRDSTRSRNLQVIPQEWDADSRMALERQRSLPISRRTTFTSNGSITLPFLSQDATFLKSSNPNPILPSAQERAVNAKKFLHDAVQSQRSTSGIVGSGTMQRCSEVQEGCR